jgi:DNA polymerase-3 subunit epsilon
VYRLLDGEGGLLYVGKATSLKNRVNSYYRTRRGDDKRMELVSQVRDVDFTSTRTSLEAALLESDEIKRTAPPYNRALKDRGERVFFYAFDLLTARESAAPRYPRGPILHRSAVDILVTLSRLLDRPIAGDALATRWIQLLRLPTRRLADGAVADGVRRFLDLHGPLARPLRPTTLLGLGARLHRQRLGTRPEPEPDEPITDDIVAEKPMLGPETVLEAVEEVLVQTARFQRRARWLSMLADATVCWRPPREPRTARRALILAAGAVTRSVRLDGNDEPPCPPGAARTRRQRRHALDRATYDRLRVLTTELRRILSRKRPVEIVLSPSIHLASADIRRILDLV